MGADVIKVEDLKGEPMRVGGKVMELIAEDGENPAFEIKNQNKRFVAIDLKTQKGMEVLHKLFAQSDVFVTNVRMDALIKLGLDTKA